MWMGMTKGTPALLPYHPNLLIELWQLAPSWVRRASISSIKFCDYYAYKYEHKYIYIHICIYIYIYMIQYIYVHICTVTYSGQWSTTQYRCGTGWEWKQHPLEQRERRSDQILSWPLTSEPLSLLPASRLSIPTLIKWWSGRALLRDCLKHPHQ